MKAKAVLIGVLLSSHAIADVTGAGDAAILTQLADIFKTANEQLKEFRKATSISENLEGMEQAKEIRRISAEGKALRDIYKESEDMYSQYQDYKEDILGSKRAENEIASLQGALEDAREKDGLAQGKAYARLLADMKRLKFLGTVHEESLKKTANGINEADKASITANSSMIMSDILLQQEQREQTRRANEVQGVVESMGSLQYGSMADAFEDSSHGN